MSTASQGQRRPAAIGPPPASPSTGRLLRVPEVAARLGVSTRTIQTWLSLGRLRPIRLSARAIRIAEGEVEEFIRRAAGQLP